MADEPVTVRGTVGHGPYAAGSKSERTTATLTTADGSTYALRAIGANPFEPDEWTDGDAIEVTGYVHRDTVLVERWVAVPIRESRRRRRAAPDAPPPSSRRPRRRRPRSAS